MPGGPNNYSRRWFDFFHVSIDEARTSEETTFVCNCVPLPDFRKLLDVCCGTGRHARALTNRGYSVTGIDRDTDAIAKARELGGGPTYVQIDLRQYHPERGAFDAVIVMSQSFGYFEPRINRDVLARLGASVRKGGRLLLDLWNPEFFVSHQGARELKTSRGIVQETKHVKDDRLFIHLEYDDGGQEDFEWQLYTPEQMKELARSLDLHLLISCTKFDHARPPAVTNPRIQFVLERGS